MERYNITEKIERLDAASRLWRDFRYGDLFVKGKAGIPLQVTDRVHAYKVIVKRVNELISQRPSLQSRQLNLVHSQDSLTAPMSYRPRYNRSNVQGIAQLSRGDV